MRCATGQRQTWYRYSRNPEAGDGLPYGPPAVRGDEDFRWGGSDGWGYFS